MHDQAPSGGTPASPASLQHSTQRFPASSAYLVRGLELHDAPALRAICMHGICISGLIMDMRALVGLGGQADGRTQADRYCAHIA
eukprot:1155176-Pelagomonas_calceolata.AAC.3